MSESTDYKALFQDWRCVVRTAGLCQGIQDRMTAMMAKMHIFPADQLPVGRDCKFVVYADPTQKILGLVFGSTDMSHVGIYMMGLLGKDHEDPSRHDLIDLPNSPLLCGGYYRKGVFCETSGDLGPTPKGMLELFSGELQRLGLSAKFNPDLPNATKGALVTGKIKSNLTASAESGNLVLLPPVKVREAA